MWTYVEAKDRFMLTTRVPRGFKEAIEAIEDAIKALPQKEEIGRTPASSNAAPDKKNKDSTPKATPKSAKKRASSPSSSTQSSKKSRLLVRVPHSPKASQGATTNSIGKASGSTPNHSKADGAGSSTVSAAATSSSSLSASPPSQSARPKHETTASSVLNAYRMTALSPDSVEPILSKNIIPTPLKIGFLGLGIMGTGMVSNLLRSGHEVTVWNRTPSKCRDFVKEGALRGNSPAEVVQGCDITFSCVSDPTALKDLVFGNCGVLQGIGPGKAYIDMSTVDVETITDVHEAVTARGGRFLEAPVIGSRQPANDGHLIILAAGDRSLYDDCYSCFEAMGKKTFFLGEIGTAAKMKLVVNLMIGSMLAGLAETLALAEKVGLDQDEVLHILELSPASCPFIKTKGTAMLLSSYSEPHCKLHSCQKDLRLAVNMSDMVDQPLHVGAAVNELFKKAKAKGYGEHDVAAVYRAADL